MTTHQNISIDDYIQHGWSLVPIPEGSKGPHTSGWNRKENALKSQASLPDGHGVGLAHAYSGTMALDIDDWGRADLELRKHGLSLQELYHAPDAVIIYSGKAGRGKLLYAMPFGLTLPSKKLVDGVNYLEFRCGTTNGLTVQDVLPPSIHPETNQPYQWAGYGHWTRLPMIPQPLLMWWYSLVEGDKTQTISTDTVSTSWDQISSALEWIDANLSREEWINVGMALHWAGSQTNQLDQALQIWNEWSMQSENKYPGERELLTQWKSFRTDKSTAVKLGTLFHIARRYGWKPPAPDASSMFTTVEPTQLVSPAELTNNLRPPPPEMPLDVWPSVIRTRAEEVSESVGCDPLVPLFAGLAAVCAVIDARSRLELMPGFKVAPVLWLMTLGEPADKKTPGSKPMLSPLRDIEAEDRPRYQKDLLDWEAREAGYAAAKKAFLEFAASPDALLGGQAPHVPDLPAPPVGVKLTVSDVTSQKLVRIAADRPRGVLCHLDEMNSWVRKMVDKSSGEDRSAWVVSYEADKYEMDRVGAGSIHAENLAVAIYGNIQPRVFRENLKNLAGDGMLQRFIPAILRSHKTRLGQPVPEHLTSAGTWENTLRLIYALPVQEYRLSPEAYTVFRDYQAKYEQGKQDERLLLSSDTFMTAFGKLEGTAGRLIFLFHVLENPFCTVVDADIVHRVIKLIYKYIIPAYRYAFSELAGASTFDHWLTEYVIQWSDKPTLSIGEIRHSARRQLEGMTTWQADDKIMQSMWALESVNWVRRIDEGHVKHTQKAEWVVNPALQKQFEDYRRSIIEAKKRQRDELFSDAQYQGRVHGE